MADNSIKQLKNSTSLLHNLIIVTLIIAITLNFYILVTYQSLTFDSLFFFPVILVAYCYPRRGVYASVGIAVVYLAMVLFAMGTGELQTSPEMVMRGIEHAGFFIIIGSAVSYLNLRFPEELNIIKLLTESVEPSRIKIVYIPALLLILSAVVFFLNSLALQVSHTLIFYPLLYIPIIFIAYFYPHRGVLASAVIAVLYFGMVGAAPNLTMEIIITGIGNASIFIIIGFLVSFLNIRFSREETIHKYLAEIIESSVSDAIIGLTLDGTITHWNKGAERLYGYTAKEVIGKSIILSHLPDQLHEMQYLLEKIQQGTVVERYDTERITKDRQRIWISLSFSPIKNEGGTVVGASVIAHDITERKRAEQALRQTTKKLNLLNSITINDIRNAIFSLSGYLCLEDDGLLTEKDRKENLKRQIKIVQQVENWIEFARNYQDLGLKPSAWQNVVQSFLFGISHLNLSQLSHRSDAEGLEIFADPMLENVFFTLANNVIRHGGSATEIYLHYHETPEGLTLFFEDNGTGVPDNMKEKIFTRRFRQQTGMGLFLTQEILSISDITIKETGTYGKGARFEIRVRKGGYRFPDKHQNSGN